MSATLNSTGVTGSGSLTLQYSNGTVGATLDTSGNLGLGVTPSTWQSGFKAIQLSGLASWNVDGSTAGSGTYFGNNVYRDSTNTRWQYLVTGDNATQYLQSSGQHIWRTSSSGTAGNAITFTQAMTLDASGNLQIGLTNVTAYTGAGNGILGNLCSTADTNSNAFLNSSSTSPYGSLIKFTAASPNNGTNYFAACVDTTTTRIALRSNGGLANYQANNANLSDRREKTNFAPSGEYLTKICAIPVQTFNYIDQNLEADPGLTLGVVAQDVQAVAPELVAESNWGTKEEPKMRLSIYQTDLQYALMKCIQEQQALITQLQADVAELKAK